MQRERNTKQKLVTIAVTAFVLLNIPILQTVNKPLLIWGVPVLYLYVFFIWVLLIVCIYFLSRKRYS